jgi:hypothetical protein
MGCYRRRALCLVLATVPMLVAAAVFVASSAVAYTDDEDVHAVVTADGTTLTEAAKEWIKDYDQAAEARWRAAGSQAEDDIWQFKAAILINRFIPYGGRVADLSPGQISRTEYCYPQLITVGCWLYERDDRSTPSQMSGIRNLGLGWYGYGWRYQETPEETGYGAQGIMDTDSFLALYHNGCCDFIDVTSGYEGSFCDFPGDPDIQGVWSWKLTGQQRSCTQNGQPVQAPKGYYSYAAIKRSNTVLRPQADDPGIENNQGCRNSGGRCWAPAADWADKIAQELKQPANGRIRDWIAHDIAETDSPYDYTAMLLDYVPQLLYDSQSNYRADSAATITNNLPNTLHRMHDGEIIADHYPALGVPPFTDAPDLSLDFLSWPNYQNGAGTYALVADHLDEAEATRVADSQQLHLQYGNHIYGHYVIDSAGDAWLQYWFFYYYNEQGVPVFDGEHEGDWEMIQIRMSPTGQPDRATYAQHTGGESCDWAYVRRYATQSGDEGPIVYVARDSNASYFTPGVHPRFGLPDDNADGLVPPQTHSVEPIYSGAPSWTGWLGVWGNSQESPGGPILHGQWDDPRGFDESADECTAD